MNNKFVAVGISIIVLLAAIVGGFAATSKSDNNNDNQKNLDVSGKWKLSYAEIARLADDKYNLFTDPSQVKITERHMNPYDAH